MERKTRNEVCKAFLDQIFLERELERAKRDLAQKAHFTIGDAFRLFDREKRGFLSLGEFNDTIRRLIGEKPGIKLDDAYLIFKRYDKDKDGKLSFAEFNKIFIPKFDENLAHSLNNRAT